MKGWRGLAADLTVVRVGGAGRLEHLTIPELEAALRMRNAGACVSREESAFKIVQLIRMPK